GWKDLLVMGTSLLGAFIMLYDDSKANRLPFPNSQSDWLALSAGIGFSFTNVITRKSVHLSLMAKSFAVWIGVVLIALFGILGFGALLPSPSLISTSDWLMVMAVAIMLFSCTLFVQYGITHIAASRAAIIFLF